MDSKLTEILKRAELVEQAVQQKAGNIKSNVNQSNMESPIKPGSIHETGKVSLNDEIVGDLFESKINNSSMPDIVKKAMLKTVIPKQSLVRGFDEESINSLKESKSLMGVSGSQSISEGNKSFNMGESRHNRSNEQMGVREIIKEELNLILPKIIKDYFEERVIKENVQFKAGDTTFSGSVSPLPRKQKR